MAALKCLYCSLPIDNPTGRRLFCCDAHRQKYQRAKWKAEGVCTRCGKGNLRTYHTTCLTCRINLDLRVEANKKNKLCVECWRPKDRKLKHRCRQCQDAKQRRSRERYYRLKERKVCVQCRKRNLVGTNIRCTKCRLIHNRTNIQRRLK